MATSFDSILDRTKRSITGGTYRYLPDDAHNASLKQKLSDTQKELTELKRAYEALKQQPQAQPQAQPQQAPPQAQLQQELQQARQHLQEAQVQHQQELQEAQVQHQQKLQEAQTQLEEQKQQAQTQLEEKQQAQTRLEEQKQQAQTRLEEQKQQAQTQLEEQKTRLMDFESEIMRMLDGISPRRMTAGGTGAFQEDAILSVLGSTVDRNESARVALEAMRETLQHMGKHKDLVKQWDRTLSQLDTTTPSLVVKPTEPPTPQYENVPTVVGIVPIVERLLRRYDSARAGQDRGEATLARAEFESAMLEATGVQYALTPMKWELVE